MGRKPDQDVARSEIWRIRATEAESAELDRQCEAAGLDRSRYIRGLVNNDISFLAPGGPVVTQTGTHVHVDLRPASTFEDHEEGGQWFNGKGEPIDKPSATPDFDGETYDRERDHTRLSSALERVKAILSDGQWHSIAEVADRANISPAATSARFRDLRKEKFGGHTVERRNLGGGFWQYRLVVGE